MKHFRCPETDIHIQLSSLRAATEVSGEWVPFYYIIRYSGYILVYSCNIGIVVLHVLPSS